MFNILIAPCLVVLKEVPVSFLILLLRRLILTRFTEICSSSFDKTGTMLFKFKPNTSATSFDHSNLLIKLEPVR